MDFLFLNDIQFSGDFSVQDLDFVKIDNYQRFSTLLLDRVKYMHQLKNKACNSLSANKRFRALVFVALSPDAYNNPEKIADILVKYEEVESADIVAGNWELVLEIRTKDQNEFYGFLKKAIHKENSIAKINSIISLKHIKSISY
jgi:DNA-binding Lrp family transcriptional regulator